MERRRLPELLHLGDGKIAHTDGPYLSLLEQTTHHLRSLGNGCLRIGPMSLIDIDVVGLETFQRRVDLCQNPVAACVAKRLPLLPVEAYFGCNHCTLAQPGAGDGFADDFFGMSEAVNRRGVDEIDAVAERGLDGSNRLAFVAAAPHPSADGPCSDAD